MTGPALEIVERTKKLGPWTFTVVHFPSLWVFKGRSKGFYNNKKKLDDQRTLAEAPNVHFPNCLGYTKRTTRNTK